MKSFLTDALLYFRDIKIQYLNLLKPNSMPIVFQVVMVILLLAVMVFILVGIRRLVNLDAFDDFDPSIYQVHKNEEEIELEPFIEVKPIQNSIINGPSRRRL